MQELIEFLRSCPEGFNTSSGLCANAYEVALTREQCRAFDYAMCEVVKTWEHYSSNLTYPIAGCVLDARLRYMAAHATHTLYIGEYGRRRIELANLIADELEKQLCKS